MDSAFPKGGGVDSRFRGNDGHYLRYNIPNDTTTPGPMNANPPPALLL
jgi:hypothetical protein